jgi:hypothetical protein
MVGKLGTLLQIGRTFGPRAGLQRLSYETQRASGLMLRRMQSVRGWDAWALKRIAPNHSPEGLLRNRREGDRPFFFADPRTLAPELKKILAAHEESVVAEANRVAEGSLPFFGRLSFDCGFPPRWFQNPVTGQSVSPQRFWTGMRFAAAPDDYGDLKFILEPSRFLFSYPLVRAYILTGDERFPEAFWTAIENWAANSPPMSGPLWICGQESSLRILAWSFALHAFLHSPSTTAPRTALLFSLIAAHAWRTMSTLGYARSQRSNHLVSEAVGLWTAGTLYPELSDASIWQKKGALLLREAVLDQITPDGSYLQDSFNYQRMVLHQLLWTIRLAEVYKTALDPQIRSRTAAAFDLIQRFVDVHSGHAPNHGSNDGSHILPLTACDYCDFRPLLRLGSTILNRSCELQSGPWDELALWLCGKYSLSAQSEITNAASSTPGYYRIGSKNSWAFVRAGLYTRRPFQADQLHVDLWWRGVNLARDAGTYLYNGEPPWNNGFAGTAVHNTVTVDRQDQMRRAGRFLWLDWAQASGQSSARKADFSDSFQGQHNGYRKLGVTHRRSVHCVTEDAWVIVDDLSGTGQHESRLHCLLPDLPFEVSSVSPFCVTLSSKEIRFRYNILCNTSGNAAIVRGGKSLLGNLGNPDSHPHQEEQDQQHDQSLLGWESPTYGELCPALSLVYSAQAPLPVRIVTVILADQALQIQQRERELTLSYAGSELYRVGLIAEQTLKRNV